jgi:DNA replication and repair protein RecF
VKALSRRAGEGFSLEPMRLLSATIRRFRNLGEVTLEPGPRATVLVGENGQGKTNTLEALYWVGTLRPLRATRLSELVQFGHSQEGTEVRATFQLAGGPREFAVRLVSGERSVEVDGKRVSSLDDYVGSVVVVAFTPDDLVLVKGAPEERRRFLDRAVFGRFPAYLGESRDYVRALKSRNRLLRERAPAGVREAFDLQLARLGARLWRRRLTVIDELVPHVERAFEAVGRLPVPLRLSYRAAAVELDPALDERALTGLLAKGLEDRLPLDHDRGFTSVGPHADDLAIHLGERPARLYGSQGQQRACVLALKIGEIENLHAQLGRYPLLLLDDVSSELDPDRNRYLMEYLRSLDAQVILTTTDAGLVRAAAGEDAMLYRVRAGELMR